MNDVGRMKQERKREREHTKNDYQALKFKCHRSDPGRIIRKYFFLYSLHHLRSASTIIVVKIVSLAWMDEGDLSLSFTLFIFLSYYLKTYFICRDKNEE
jgi:hypothetical protein